MNNLIICWGLLAAMIAIAAFSSSNHADCKYQFRKVRLRSYLSSDGIVMWVIEVSNFGILWSNDFYAATKAVSFQPYCSYYKDKDKAVRDANALFAFIDERKKKEKEQKAKEKVFKSEILRPPIKEQ